MICGNEQLEARSVGILSGFFFHVNYIIGTGFLSVPYAFYRGGTLVVTVTLLLTSFVSWNSANYTVECMARAQVSFCVVSSRALVRTGAYLYMRLLARWNHGSFGILPGLY